MHTMNCKSRAVSRCHTPLIELCDDTSQIKLDLGACHPCAGKATALLLRKGGCTEYETVCEEIEDDTCCGSTSRRVVKRAVPKPRPTVIYPLHEVNPMGASVFVLDGKLKTLGYGRYEAVVLVDGCATDMIFDVEYICSLNKIVSITTERLQPNLGECP